MTRVSKMEAVHEMVKGFNAVKTSIIDIAYSYRDGFDEITPKIIEVGTYVDYNQNWFHLNDCYELEVIEVYADTLLLQLTDDEDVEEYGEELEVLIEDCECDDNEYDHWLPSCGWLWSVDTLTEEFVRNNLETVAACGFRIYDDEDGDLYLGIDGGNYDFYEEHWLPLYNAMYL